MKCTAEHHEPRLYKSCILPEHPDMTEHYGPFRAQRHDDGTWYEAGFGHWTTEVTL